MVPEDRSRSRLRRQLASLAIPLAGTQLSAVALAATNTAMMGRLGVTALAAGGLSMVVFNQFRTIGTGLITSVGNEIASAPPSGWNPRTVASSRSATLRAGLLVAGLAGVLGGVIIAASGGVMTFLGQDATIAAAASPFLIFLAPGLLPVLWFQVLRQYAIGMGRPQSVLTITLCSIALNVALGSALASGWGPIPRLGLTGIGLAISVVQFFSCALLAILVRLDRVLAASLTFSLWKATRSDTAKILRHGYKIAATFGSTSFFYLGVAFLMGTISPLALAAHNVVYQVFSIGFQLANGLSQASSIVISRLWSVKDVTSSTYTNAVSLVAIGVVTALLGVSYVVLPEFPLAIFAAHETSELARAARTLLVIALAAQVAEGCQNISVGVLRGLGDTSSSLRFSLLGCWLVGLPTALLLAFPLRLGAVGIWLGITVGLAFVGVALQRRVRRTLRSARAQFSPSG
jgi:MATE family multidrug resistance protein